MRDVYRVSDLTILLPRTLLQQPSRTWAVDAELTETSLLLNYMPCYAE
jgi:hypothetical protein